MSKFDLVVVIPVYNEEEIIETVLEDWFDCLESLKINFLIHVYNDGSKDSSLSVIENVARANSKIIVHDKENSGHGATILKGYTENNNAEWVFQVDSDNEISTEFFSSLWKQREYYDFLIGYRIYKQRSVSRRIITTFSKITVDVVYGKGIKDVNIPYRLFRTCLFKPYINNMSANTFAPNVIISGIAVYSKFRIKQIPVNFSNRQTGTVSIKKLKLLKSAFKSFFQTLKYRKAILVNYSRTYT